MLSLVCISLTLYGGGCVFIVLIADLFRSIFTTWADINFTLCLWMVFVAAILTPLTWMGTPKDFWSVHLYLVVLCQQNTLVQMYHILYVRP